MYKSISIYPNIIDEEYINKVSEILKSAFKYKIDGVFSSIHLPEFSLQQQLQCLKIIADENKEYGFELTVDIGGSGINDILDNEEYLNELKKLKIDYLRLDYGYDLNQIKRLYSVLDIKGFVINASMYDEKKIEEKINDIRGIDEDIAIKACHNFYVRKDTGLDDSFAMMQDSYFRKHDVEVFYFVPSYSHTRGPVHEGLCTIERHRYRKIDEIVRDLKYRFKADGIIMADEWLSNEEFQMMEKGLKDIDDYSIRVRFIEGISDEEKNIVLGNHIFRYDSPSNLLRSISSRQMAEKARLIKPNNMIERKHGSITIDNELYKRYSGEMQVLLDNMEADERVNVVGYINNDDLYKLSAYKDGMSYDFIEEKEGE